MLHNYAIYDLLPNSNFSTHTIYDSFNPCNIQRKINILLCCQIFSDFIYMPPNQYAQICFVLELRCSIEYDETLPSCTGTCSK